MSEAPSTAPRATERLAAAPADVARAASLLAARGLVAFPTETVYGLGADARSDGAVASLYAAKERPHFNPLIAHVTDLTAARRQGRFPDAAEALAAAFWPGPLTLVVPLADTCEICDLARAGLDTVALRVPDHPVALDLLRRCGFPVVAPSANLSGRVSPTAAAHVLTDLDGRIDAVLDGGPTAIGVESTIVLCGDGSAQLLRPGGVAREALERALGERLRDALPPSDRPIAPGALASHYAPRARVRLDARTVEPGEAALLFGPFPEPVPSTASLNLSARGDLTEAAANLFGFLRRLDGAGVATIAVAPIPDRGIGEAINDRLRRAAADR